MIGRLQRALLCAALMAGCAEPCGGGADPSLTLAGSNDEGTSFELFDDGARRSLIQGPQLGMHVWLQLRLEGFCAESARVDRRVVDDATEELLEIQRSPLRFVEGPTLGSLELEAPLTMQLCPADASVIGRRLRFMARAEDDEGHVDIAEKPFVPVCASGDCPICDAP